MDVRATEGFIPFHGYRTWYRVIEPSGPTEKSPLLCLHGGPGFTHDCLEPYEALAREGRRVVFYDQLGAGRSALEAPHDPSMWTVSLFVEEIDVVRRALGLDSTHILGLSWGGMLAMEYALTRPDGVASLILESAPASMPLWVTEANRLRAGLPGDVQATLLRHETEGTTADPAYQQAVDVFNRRHLCRTVPLPDCVARTLAAAAAHPEVYNTMNGPSEFHVIGTLKDWDITARLPEIRSPTLVLSGRFDEATPVVAGAVRDGIPGAEWVLFEESSHMCHVEETERCLAVVNEFLSRVEAAGR